MAYDAADYEDRHPAVREIMRWFDFDHLAEGSQARAVSACIYDTTQAMLMINDGPELTAGLRKLLEAKDCFVRASFDN